MDSKTLFFPPIDFAVFADALEVAASDSLGPAGVFLLTFLVALRVLRGLGCRAGVRGTFSSTFSAFGARSDGSAPGESRVVGGVWRAGEYASAGGVSWEGSADESCDVEPRLLLAMI